MWHKEKLRFLQSFFQVFTLNLDIYHFYPDIVIISLIILSYQHNHTKAQQIAKFS